MRRSRSRGSAGARASPARSADRRSDAGDASSTALARDGRRLRAACVRVDGRLDLGVRQSSSTARREDGRDLARRAARRRARRAIPAALVADVDAVLADNRFPDFVLPICAAARARGIPVVLDGDQATRARRSAVRDRLARRLFRGGAARDHRPATTSARPRRASRQRSRLPRGHRRRRRRAVAARRGAVRRLPVFAVAGGRHARRRRRLPRRLRAGAGRGPRRGRGHALCAPPRPALKCTRFGGISGTPARAEVEAFLAGRDIAA